MAITVTSKFFGLNLVDFGKALIVACLSTPLTLLVDSLNAGNFNIDWKHLATLAAVSGVSYILKNVISPAAVKITGLDSGTIQAIKSGEQIVKVVDTPKA